MGAIELISEFDQFLHEHLEKCKKEKVNVTYLSKTVYEELIEIMGKHMQGEIVSQINIKYYSIVADSTPDVAHFDQLVIVVRYCYSGKPCDRFLTFLRIQNYLSITLFNAVQKILCELKLPLENIRGQSYDNASNMKGSEKGLQALFKNINKCRLCTMCSPFTQPCWRKRCVCCACMKLLIILAFCRSYKFICN